MSEETEFPTPPCPSCIGTKKVAGGWDADGEELFYNCTFCASDED